MPKKRYNYFSSPYPDNGDFYELCDECESVFPFDGEEHLWAYLDNAQDQYGNNVSIGLCKKCFDELADKFAFDMSDYFAKYSRDNAETIRDSIIPFIYSYEELIALVRKDISERISAGNTEDISKIKNAIREYCDDDPESFAEFAISKLKEEGYD